jgi:hypothetical protein
MRRKISRTCSRRGLDNLAKPTPYPFEGGGFLHAPILARQIERASSLAQLGREKSLCRAIGHS